MKKITSELRNGLLNPRRALWEIHRLYQREILQHRGIEIMQRDWDNLIILDGCRYDLFSEMLNIEGHLRKVISRGSSTSEFIHNNFKADQYHDSIYVSANPQTRRHDLGRKFYKEIPLWETDWNKELRTVPPEDVVDAAIKTHREYPDKKLIIHFIQPHYPFIGETGQEIEHRSITGDGVLSEVEQAKEDVWSKLEKGEITKQIVWQAYKENLDIVLPEVDRLLSEINGKSIVTSDHGNSFGRWNVYGHPGKVYIKELVEVPWFEPKYEKRRHVTTETPQISEHGDHSSVQQRLRDLGYDE